MIGRQPALPSILEHSPTRVVFGAGELAHLGASAAELGSARVLLVTDPGIVAAGHVERAVASLQGAKLSVVVFDGVEENPTTEHVAAGLHVAQEGAFDLLVAVGGGSAMDCCKGINILLTNGGQIADYWGTDKTTQALLPMIAVPTTAGTGSEAQSFALICDPKTHQKMACGDRRLPTEGGLRPRVAILDPDLTLSQPQLVAASAGMDALAHAVETAGARNRNDNSRAFSREAWNLLEPSYQRAVRDPSDDEARSMMLLGAHLAGAAIENSMLGAAHACANPLTARCGLTHGLAVGLLLPHVVRFNAAEGGNPYEDLGDGAALAERIEILLDAAGLPRRLSECGVKRESLEMLAEEASRQWTASFNPRPVGRDELFEIYLSALD